jgi:hypothetical protein
LQSRDEGRLANGLPRNPVLEGYEIPSGFAVVVETLFVVVTAIQLAVCTVTVFFLLLLLRSPVLPFAFAGSGLFGLGSL